MQLDGLHHVTAVSAKIAGNVEFYTQVLGLRLVKKSVNQDDVSAYHLFYADKLGSPGTDMTFFDWPHIGPNGRGTDSIAGTAFRVSGEQALQFWADRFDDLGVDRGDATDFAGRMVLPFEDLEGQRLYLVDDKGTEFEGEIWQQPDIPDEFALRGFYSILLSMPSILLKDFETEKQWRNHLIESGLYVSGLIDRFWFRSIYFRVSNGILFEIATDGPGFAIDEDLENLGEKLVLPPFLESRRREIEAGLTPIGA
ncbi:MAG: VOC family protein [Anaerolineales bacterium]